eukprot:EG_transcript_5821
MRLSVALGSPPHQREGAGEGHGAASVAALADWCPDVGEASTVLSGPDRPLGPSSPSECTTPEVPPGPEPLDNSRIAVAVLHSLEQLRAERQAWAAERAALLERQRAMEAQLSAALQDLRQLRTGQPQGRDGDGGLPEETCRLAGPEPPPPTDPHGGPAPPSIASAGSLPHPQSWSATNCVGSGRPLDGATAGERVHDPTIDAHPGILGHLAGSALPPNPSPPSLPSAPPLASAATVSGPQAVHLLHTLLGILQPIPTPPDPLPSHPTPAPQALPAPPPPDQPTGPRSTQSSSPARPRSTPAHASAEGSTLLALEPRHAIPPEVGPQPLRPAMGVGPPSPPRRTGSPPKHPPPQLCGPAFGFLPAGRALAPAVSGQPAVVGHLRGRSFHLNTLKQEREQPAELPTLRSTSVSPVRLRRTSSGLRAQPTSRSSRTLAPTTAPPSGTVASTAKRWATQLRSPPRAPAGDPRPLWDTTPNRSRSAPRRRAHSGRRVPVGRGAPSAVADHRCLYGCGQQFPLEAAQQHLDRCPNRPLNYLPPTPAPAPPLSAVPRPPAGSLRGPNASLALSASDISGLATSLPSLSFEELVSSIVDLHLKRTVSG